jgi:hypothetical protein
MFSLLIELDGVEHEPGRPAAIDVDLLIELKLHSRRGKLSGLWICAKWLEKGRFSWPSDAEQSNRVTLSHEELSLLLGGIDLTRTWRKDWYRKELELSEKM